MSLVYIAAGVVVFVAIIMIILAIASKVPPQKASFVSGFYGGPINGSSSLACGHMSSEAEELYSLFVSKNPSKAEEGSADMKDLKNLLSKLCCFKHDLMSPQQVISAVKEVGFTTSQDIQPIGDLTGRCFSKTIPERDLSLQFIKWRTAGNNLIHRLCTEGGLSESEVVKAEKLFAAAWKDVNDVATTQCLASLPTSAKGRFDPDPMETKDVISLKHYDGLY